MTRESSVDSAVYRNASEAAIEALRSAGFTSLATSNSFYASSLTDHVVSAVKSFSATQMASLSSNSGALVATALASLDKVIGQLTPAQQAAAKAGIDPTNTAAVAAFAAHGGSGLFADGKLGLGVAGRSGGHSSNDFQRELTAGHYTASNLPPGLRGLVDPSQGITPAHVAGVANYLGGLGLNPQSYAPYFVGSSQAARDTLKGFIKHGDKIDDIKIKTSKDMIAVMGALKATGKNEDDPSVPASMRQVIKDMRKSGIDPINDPKAANKYLYDHPGAMDAAKRQDQQDKKDAAGLTKDQKQDKIEKEKPKTVPLSKKKTGASTPAPTTSL